MAPSPRPFLVLLAGPNGSGKTTLYETRIARAFNAPFINADLIQRDELRQVDMDAGELPLKAVDGQLAFMTLHDSMADAQPESRPFALGFG